MYWNVDNKFENFQFFTQCSRVLKRNQYLDKLRRTTTDNRLVTRANKPLYREFVDVCSSYQVIAHNRLQAYSIHTPAVSVLRHVLTYKTALLWPPLTSQRRSFGFWLVTVTNERTL